MSFDGCPKTGWPTTLQEWRDQNKVVDQHGDCKMFCHGWLSMEGAFRKQGVSLYHPVDADPGEDFWLREPPEGIHPKTSQYAYGFFDQRRVQQRCASNYPALLNDKTRAIVRIVGHRHQKSPQCDIMRYLNSQKLRSKIANHTIPILQELQYEDWIFMVLPYLGDDVFDELRPFKVVGEVTCFIEQTLEGLAFLHDHFIAHRDISADNIVINIVGSREKSWRSSQKHPTIYYFIDFELAIRFDLRSDPNPWVVSGLPMAGFQRVAAPEVRGLIPYCPFKADVYALGFIYYEYFRQCEQWLGSVINVSRGMLVADANQRTSAQIALEDMREAISRITSETSLESIPGPLDIPDFLDEKLAAVNSFALEYMSKSG